MIQRLEGDPPKDRGDRYDATFSIYCSANTRITLQSFGATVTRAPGQVAQEAFNNHTVGAYFLKLADSIHDQRCMYPDKEKHDIWAKVVKGLPSDASSAYLLIRRSI